MLIFVCRFAVSSRHLGRRIVIGLSLVHLRASVLKHPLFRHLLLSIKDFFSSEVAPAASGLSGRELFGSILKPFLLENLPSFFSRRSFTGRKV